MQVLSLVNAAALVFLFSLSSSSAAVATKQDDEGEMMMRRDDGVGLRRRGLGPGLHRPHEKPNPNEIFADPKHLGRLTRHLVSNNYYDGHTAAFDSVTPAETTDHRYVFRRDDEGGNLSPFSATAADTNENHRDRQSDGENEADSKNHYGLAGSPHDGIGSSIMGNSKVCIDSRQYLISFLLLSRLPFIIFSP